MSKRQRDPGRRATRFALAAVVAVATLAVAGSASATVARYQATITPTTATAGAVTTATLKVKSLSVLPLLGSVNIAVPSGWTDVSVGAPQTLRANGTTIAKGWTAQLVSGVIQLRSTSSLASKLAFLQSVTVPITAKAGCTAGSSTWQTGVRSSHLFTGIAFSILGSQPSIAVSGVCADHLAFDQQPSDADVGEAIAPPITVRVEDVGNGLVDDDATQVTLSVGQGPGALSGDLTATASNGVATFSNVSVDDAGTYTLVASATGLDPAESLAFEITFRSTTIATTPGTAATGDNCGGSGDPTDPSITSCVGVDLPNGANGPVQLLTTSTALCNEGVNTCNAVLGNFKDGESEPLYDADTPGFITLEIDESLLPGCDEYYESERRPQSYVYEYEGDYIPYADPDGWYFEPRTCLQVEVQFVDEGAWYLIPVCGEDHPEYFDDEPDGDEYVPPEGIFDEGANGACMAASDFDEDGDLILYVAFFGDPRLGTR